MLFYKKATSKAKTKIFFLLRVLAVKNNLPRVLSEWLNFKLDDVKKINLYARYEYVKKMGEFKSKTSNMLVKYNESLSLKNKLQIVLLEDTPCNDEKIPNKIWMYWDSGIDGAPDVVQVAYNSWIKMNPDFDVMFLDAKSVQKYFDFDGLFNLLSVDIGAAHRADFIRTYFLYFYGGIWADATSFCWKPLQSWLYDATKDTGLFFFKQDKSRVDRQIKNWFIASSKGNPVIRHLLISLIEYNFRDRKSTLQLIKPKKYISRYKLTQQDAGYELLSMLESNDSCPYFYYHYLFNEVVKKPECKFIWMECLATQNKYNNHQSAYGEIGEAYVSKQTYKGKYPKSTQYHQRVNLLADKLETIDK